LLQRRAGTRARLLEAQELKKVETDRTSRHPIRFTILVAIAAALATIALVLASSGNNPALAATSLVNGNFETGDLTGWSVDTATSGGAASAVDRFVYWDNLYCEYDCRVIIPPREGSYFALLTSAGQPPQATRISQPFKASNGDKVSGWVFFQTYTDWYDLNVNGAGDDKAQVVITNDSGTTVATPFEDRASWGFWQWNPGWRYWEHNFSGLTGTAQFRIEARLQIPGPNCWAYYALEDGCSVMGLDDVKTSIAGPDTTPPETYITSGPKDGVTTTSTSATFEFYSNEQGSTFECRLWKDNTVVQEWAGCTSPKSYSNLSSAGSVKASYTFHVRATDPSGNVDPHSASRSWSITPPPPDTTAPEVKSTVPKGGAMGVDRTTNVTATFSEDMSASSINGQTFKLFKQGSTTKIAATVSYHPDPDLNSPPIRRNSTPPTPYGVGSPTGRL
jgi:hypothetical protein